MTLDRIKEIQKETGYPDSVSVRQALLKVWNECEQQIKNLNIPCGKDTLSENHEFMQVEIGIAVCLNCGTRILRKANVL